MSVGKPVYTRVSDSFTRPANTTAYASGDLVANDVDAVDVVPLEFSFTTSEGRGLRIVGAKIKKSNTTATNSSMSLHLYSLSPDSVVGDNGVFSTNESTFIGSITFPTMQAYTDACTAVMHSGAVSGGFNPLVWEITTTDRIYGLLKAEAAYTPASAEVFTVNLIVEQY